MSSVESLKVKQESCTSLSSSAVINSCSSSTNAKYNILNDFKIIKTVGIGTFGRVCLVRNKNTKQYGAMKVLILADVIQKKQVQHVKNEKNILMEIKHPFIVNLQWYTKDNSCIYMLFEFVSGGELFTYLRKARRFNEYTANFFCAEVITALEYLHARSIVYRDLKPENLLLDRDGHLKITDFGFSKKLTGNTWTLCGTMDYLAPEIIQCKGYNKAVDWWALGVLIYEMLSGCPPFYDKNSYAVHQKILSGKIEWIVHVDPVPRDLIRKLLVLNRTRRLGNLKNGAQDIKNHSWFNHLDWEDVVNKKLKPPIIPRVRYESDTDNFDHYPDIDWKKIQPIKVSELRLFEDF